MTSFFLSWRQLQNNIPLLLILVVGAYFMVNFFQGEYGLFRYLQVNAQIEAAEKELNALVAEREELQNLTKRLSNGYLDLDLLDEQARKRLGLVHPNEIIFR